MATGDLPDLISRLKRYLPARWFGPGPTPILDTLIGGIASAFFGVYALYAFAVLQIRIATATGGWLTLYAYDFFGDTFPPFKGERDAAYSTRIRQEVFRDRNTRNAIDRAVFDLTGVHPHIWEGFHAPTCGGWGTYGLAWGRVGRWGSRRAQFFVIVTMPEPANYGIPNRGGWGSGVGGWGVGNWSWVDANDFLGSGPTKEDIMNSINRVRAAGITIYCVFTNTPGTGTP